MGQLKHEEPARGKENSRMARKTKRQYGSGCLMNVGGEVGNTMA